MLRGLAAAGIGALAGRNVVFHWKNRRIERNPHKVSVLETCVVCGSCVSVCPKGALSILPEGLLADQAACVGCGYCQTVCPVEGIRVNEGGVS